MLVLAGFEIEEKLVNSDGEAIMDCGASEYVAIYDNEKFDERNLQSTIKNVLPKIEDRGTFYQDNIVFLPEDIWDKLEGMIEDNYTLEKKE